MMSIGRNFAAVLLFAGMSAVALAQPAILIGDESVAPGGNADVSLDFLGDGTVTQLNFRFTYDPDVLTADITNCGGNSTVSPGQTSCSIPSPGEISVVHANISTTALADGTFGSVNFTAAADVSPGTVFPLEFSVESFSNADAEAVAPSGSEEGSVTIQCPTGESCYLSDPPTGSTITFGGAEVGQATTPNEIIGVSNAQNDDASTFEVAGITSTGTDV
ncbi:MAG: cohesin domain-containing protein, partial [Pseudomonadota bacterium]